MRLGLVFPFFQLQHDLKGGGFSMKYISVRETAERAKVSTQRVRGWIVSGLRGRKLPALRIGYGFAVRPRDLDAFLRFRERELQSAR